MHQVKAAAIVEMLRQGKPQILFAIMATCMVNVANTKHIRPLASRWIGNCFCLAVVPSTLATKSKTGAMAVRRLCRRSAFSGWVMKR